MCVGTVFGQQGPGRCLYKNRCLKLDNGNVLGGVWSSALSKFIESDRRWHCAVKLQLAWLNGRQRHVRKQRDGATATKAISSGF